jgi:UDP-N-acetylglucosamine diphosphorylase / glucose-1-phosphate thymidylyltransferase / UDP-N-acetylgalactosamine diphosphorylase / glucosamine-1-phosphate N-acetyltransferase / galactosamine-1-phosphate N-acetyltransferase
MELDFLKPEAFFDLSSFSHRDLFAGCSLAWEALGNMSKYLEGSLDPNVGDVGCFGRPLEKTLVLWKGKVLESGFEILGGDVTKGKFRVRIGGEETSEAAVLFAGSTLWDDRIFIGPGVVLEPGALVKGPTIIGAQTDVRQGAYVRGKCVVGQRCVIGHTTEVKSSIMFDGAKAGHFAYIGDSILGNETNLGAGTKLANLKIRGTTVQVIVRNTAIDTGLRKLGAVLGDRVEIGCNAVTNPGAILGMRCLVYPLTSVRHFYYEPDSVIRS